jgi:hypothetical protein
LLNGDIWLIAVFILEFSKALNSIKRREGQASKRFAAGSVKGG